MMRSKIGRIVRQSSDAQLGKTWLGRLVHDVGATVLKATVQPFKSFSNTEKYDKIFNPVMQTKTFSTVGKGVDVLDSVGHVAGKTFTNYVTGGIVDVKSKPKSNSVESDVEEVVQKNKISIDGLIKKYGRSTTLRKIRTI